MEENTQLPKEVVEQIKTNAALRCDRNEGRDDSSFMNGYYSGYITGATAYATKLHQAETRLEENHNRLLKADDLLKEVFRKHEAGLDRLIYEKIKTFLYGE